MSESTDRQITPEESRFWLRMQLKTDSFDCTSGECGAADCKNCHPEGEPEPEDADA